ncbi:hypothetical protein RHSP_59046 [Rhizobium freirei PRF 81]|uniref:Uncharacterized protein n=1 Tax=Rhizobium freirei PRF 81 TaxID=363754 RepID=N6TWZ3_9HYPH|nr:hypothetical protein RHSP_59046 [Rhizobium freirei PRF 81]
MHILPVEDEPEMASVLMAALKRQDVVVDHAFEPPQGRVDVEVNVLQIAQLHGGSIAILNGPWKGAHVRIQLPLHRRAA